MTALLPDGVVEDLLRRWSEPHRRYHGVGHLERGLVTLDQLGAGRLEKVAFWFHDAVHRGVSPVDEEASAELARRMLSGLLPERDVLEISRLVLVTVDHDPEPGDRAAELISDADLAEIASPWPRYERNAADIRAERPGVDDAEWSAGRLVFIDRLLGRAEIFRTPQGRAWEGEARRNLARERSALTTLPGSGRSGA